MPHVHSTPIDPRTEYKGVVVAVGGPPHSGKSVFVAEMYHQLMLRPIPFFLERACPDGEGMWSAETDPALVREIRRKGAFSPEFISAKVSSIENLGRCFPLVLVDLGGQLADDNALYLARCTHAIILSFCEEEVEPWRRFAAAVKCPTLAVFHSRLARYADGTLDDTARSSIDFSTSPVQGRLFNLDREGRNQPYKDAVTQVVEWLLSLAHPALS